MTLLEPRSHVRATGDASGPMAVTHADLPAGPARVAVPFPMSSSAMAGPSRGGFGGGCPPRVVVGSSWGSPWAAAMPTYLGRGIRGLAAHEGRIFIGSGECGASGEVAHVHSIDTTTGQLSGSLLGIAGAQIAQMKVIGGALYVTNLAPEVDACGAQPFASDRGGAWSMSGRIDCRRVFDLEAVPGRAGALMVAGSHLDELTGGSSAATWLTTDGGFTWSSFLMPAARRRAAAGAEPVVRMMLVGEELYAIAGGAAWRWRKVLPSRPCSVWSEGWERVELHQHCQILSMPAVATGGNGRFAAWAKGPMWTFDGTSVRRMFGHLDFGQAFCTDGSDGHVYAVTRAAGIVRSLNGVDWFRHPEPGVWGARGLPATSIAVHGGVIYVGDDTSAVHAVASSAVTWRRASTT
jgi:hypothetical protein